mmetsp:Transcript_9756/g.28856  ORF Transcript_9756/g.28856 Transcript_9756/m.28856 type:complete len:366 (-) Transcript_9756:264-1361(-)
MWNLQVLQKFVLLITSPCIPTVCGFKNDLTENCEGPAKLQPLADERTSHLLEIVHVVYSGDARTFPGLVSSMISLARHLQVPEKCVIHLIVSEGDLGRARRMVHVFKHELGSMAALPNVTLHRMQALPLDISRFETPWFRPELLTAHNYARFYLHQYLPGVQRALWLDPDTIVRSDVMPLYRMRMQHALAARPFLVNGYNLLGELRERFKMFAYQSPRRHWDFPNESLHMPTFSTGVLLYDLNLWRSGSLTRALERWSQVLLGFMGTQLVMSVQFVDKFDPMDWWWNVEGLGIVASRLPQHCIDGAKILHWSGPHKPWLPRTDHWVWGKWIRDHDYLFETFAVRSSKRCAASSRCRNAWTALHAA